MSLPKSVLRRQEKDACSFGYFDDPEGLKKCEEAEKQLHFQTVTLPILAGLGILLVLAYVGWRFWKKKRNKLKGQ